MAPLKPKGSASLGLEPYVPAPRGVLAKLWPWLVSLAILAYLFSRIPEKTLFNALKAGPWFSLGAYTFIQTVLVLLADAYATLVSLAITGFRQRFSLIFLARGATYMLGILNYALGQGAFGLYLQRSGVTTIRVAGMMLFLMIINLGVLLLVASFGLMTGAYLGSNHFNLSPLGYGLVIGVLLYLAIIGFRPRFLQRYHLLAPLLEAGLRGHLRAVAGRLPHMLVLVLTYWGALRLWGVPVPLAQGIALVPVVLLIGALPFTPAGLGTTQAALVLLFSPYVPLPTPEVRVAELLAFSLIYYFLGIMAQALLGFWCWLRLRHIG
jgi:uncharacterized membrane protein YbhN (UPF0104 family)